MTTKKEKEHQKLSYEDLQQKCEEYLNGWQRAQADYQNLEKEMARQKQEWMKMANADLLVGLLPIYDNLKLALRHIPQEQRKLDWVIGIEHIKNQLAKFLEDFGVEEIRTVGEKFDVELHEAVRGVGSYTDDTLISSDSADVKIKKEIRPGYKLNGKVLQAAKVEM